MYVFILTGDYGSRNEYIDVVLNYNYDDGKRCYGLTGECANSTLCEFDQKNSSYYNYSCDYSSCNYTKPYIDLSDYINSSMSSNYLAVTLNSTERVDGFCNGANNSVVRGFVTIMCDIYGNFTYSPTDMPTEMPTASPTAPTESPTNRPTQSPTNATIDYHLFFWEVW